MKKNQAPDYLWGCPVCGQVHDPKKRIWPTRMNRHCYRAFNRASEKKRKKIRDRTGGIL